ncbi:hypothetical protein BX666DRAFT_1863282 [Dichotomocladium elegans]|nr:hypothetical protein BX666DRAFT_1863282 [Dichotomocladium elegans]
MPPLSVLQECHTAECIEVASYVTKFVNFSVDPCDNFYDYASIGISDDMDYAILKSVRKIMESSYQDLLKANIAPEFIEEESTKTDQELFSSLQMYYESCMNISALEKAGATPIYPVIGHLRSGWAEEGASGLTNTLIELASLNIFPLVEFTVQTDVVQDPSHYMVGTSKPSLGYADSLDITDPENVQNYRLFLTEITTYVLSPSDTNYMAALEEQRLHVLTPSQIEVFVDHAVNFSVALLNVSLLNDFGDQINVMRFDEMQFNYTFMDWRRFFESVLPKGKHVPEQIYNFNPGYLRDITNLVRNTDQETIIDFFLSQVILQKASYLDSTVLEILVKYGFSDPNPPRWMTCAGNLRNSVPDLIGRYYLMENFGGARERQVVGNYVNLIHQTYRRRLERNEWLDDETRAKAIEKIDKLNYYISYSLSNPDERSPGDLKLYFEGIIFGNEYFTNELSIARWKGLQDKWRFVDEAVDRSSDGIDFMVVNAYYSPWTNMMAIIAGILERPIYDVNYPAFVNFGSLGLIIGHEFTHGYDSYGRHFDGDGRYINWWTNRSAAAFDERAQCFVDQYNQFAFQYEDKMYHLDGEMTLGENIADNGGIAVAYEAFRNYWQSNSSAHMTLPGIDLTPDQLFFVSVPRFFCGKTEAKAIIEQLTTAAHSPGNVRVIGTLQNFEPFAEAFKCPAGSPMNPEKKCTLW